MTKILIIEDDKTLNQQLADLLRRENYRVEQCFDGELGLAAAATKRFDLVILDVMLPRRDGYSLLSLLRKSSQVPVIMLTAKGAEEERIKGFTAGADDYLAKPFNLTELKLRIEALLRRCQPQRPEQQTSLHYEQLVINRLNKTIEVAGRELDFTAIQFNLLWTLLTHKGEVLSKAFLYQTVLKKTYSDYDRSLDMHLSRVRKKLVSAGMNADILQTVRGKGYSLV